MAMVDEALKYVAEGFTVFPVKLDKTPYTTHGMKDATQTQAGVKDYWTKWPDAGIGIPTDGLVVLDFDKKNGGLESLKKIAADHGKLPETRAHRTGGGGIHLLYLNPNGHRIGNTTTLGGYKGVDVRGDGGYVVAPPSWNTEGQYKEINHLPLALCPEFVLELHRTKAPGQVTTELPEEPIPEGERNNTLTSLAGTMRRRGFPAQAIEAALSTVNQLRCQPPLPEVDIKRISKSIARYEPAEELKSLASETENTEKTPEKLKSLKKTEISVNSPEGTVPSTYKGTMVHGTSTPSIYTENYSGLLRGKKIWALTDNWLELHKDERFDLDLICRQLDLREAIDRQHVAKKLFYEVNRGTLSKKDKVYRNIDRTYTPIDWVNAVEVPPLAIKWPYGISDMTKFGFDGHTVISPGDVIVIAGVSNMGKTAFCLNLLWNNMDKYPCTLMGNEYNATKFRRRTSTMTWGDPFDKNGKPKFELIERHDNWEDIIFPDNINIIDWINLSDKFYEIGTIIENIQQRLRNGIAVISIQKADNKSLGLGGGFSEHLASLYLAIDFQRLTVVKAKEWYEVNTNGKMYGFKIEGGGNRFTNIREVKKCFRCNGTGQLKMGDCPGCLGRGYIDLD